MPVYNTFNYSKVKLKTFHASPSTIVLDTVPGIHNSQQRFPDFDDVRIGVIFGPGQFEQQLYETGTLVSGGGSASYRPIGSGLVRAFDKAMSPVSLGDTVRPFFSTCNPTTSAAVNADSLPVVTIEEDGVTLGYSPTVTNVTTGLYRVTIDCTVGNGFEAGKRYSAYVTATVTAIVGRDSLAEYEVLALDLNTTLNATIGSRLSQNNFIALK
jgi:hypothetical protein